MIIRKILAQNQNIQWPSDLIGITKRSYADFLQMEVAPEHRRNIGLQKIFATTFPLNLKNGRLSIEFVSYSIGKPEFTPEEAVKFRFNYSAPLKVIFRLVLRDRDGESILDVKEQEVDFDFIPLMTENGTFVIHGIERVVLHQIHRSPGVYFKYKNFHIEQGDVPEPAAKIIPYHGSYLNFEITKKGKLRVQIDKKPHIPVTVLVKAFGATDEEILKYFYREELIRIEGNRLFLPVTDHLIGKEAHVDITSEEKLIIGKGKKYSKAAIKKLGDAGIDYVEAPPACLNDRISAKDIISPRGKKTIVNLGEHLTTDSIKNLRDKGIKNISVFVLEDPIILESLKDDKAFGCEAISTDEPEENLAIKAKTAILGKKYSNLNYMNQLAEDHFNNLFFKPSRYSLSNTGRLLLNTKLNLNVPMDVLHLTKEDILATVKHLVKMSRDSSLSYEYLKAESNDVDSLDTRRIRSVGEIIEHQMRAGLIKLEAYAKEQIVFENYDSIDNLIPSNLLSPFLALAEVYKFLSSSPLSHFGDQTNPLSTVAQKRKLTALGPGGISRDSAGFEIRDVHISHYGRLCPIESPEGQNVGLVASLSSYANVNDFGFITTPYRVVRKGKVTDEVVHLANQDEKGHVIAQFNISVDKKGNITGERISARKDGIFTLVEPREVTLMDIAPMQMIATAASLIPFFGHDDAHRALMGSNMQKQAVPLLQTESPMVGTGMEHIIARDSGYCVMANEPGMVEYVDAGKIIIKQLDGSVKTYTLKKFMRSNQSTYMNQKPVVSVGDPVKEGDVIADGPSVDHGELALGKNLLVAFMPWHGYNFEDGILINERLCKEDVLTSVHVDEYEVAAKKLRIGNEVITCNVPDAGPATLRNLDENGIIRIGTWIKPGDILVGKVTPKPLYEFQPEELLLRTIFGTTVSEVKDTSLRVPPGVEGVVIDAKIFSKNDDDETVIVREKDELNSDRFREIEIIKEAAASKITAIIKGSRKSLRLLNAKNEEIRPKSLAKMSISGFKSVTVSCEEDIKAQEIVSIIERTGEQIDLIKALYGERADRLKGADFLSDDTLKLVRVVIASKRKIQPGDKMAGRHGNKGVVSRVLQEEDMPFLPDGTPIDVVLNPLGVPSRMNIGQILEVHLGMGARSLGKALSKFYEKAFGIENFRDKIKELYNSEDMTRLIDSLQDEDVAKAVPRLMRGFKFGVPAFGGASEKDIKAIFEQVGIKDNGKTVLYNGLTGEPFENEVTVGVMYMLKLCHLVDDKIHARSVGQYSAITQQPLKGRGKFGGQRLGEMEIWAIEAYGAAHLLREITTIRSDDVEGRRKAFKQITKKGFFSIETGFPESFHTLVKELNSLCMNIELIPNPEKLSFENEGEK